MSNDFSRIPSNGSSLLRCLNLWIVIFLFLSLFFLAFYFSLFPLFLFFSFSLTVFGFLLYLRRYLTLLVLFTTISISTFTVLAYIV